MDDTYLLEWGRAVTDAELRAVAAMPVNLDTHCGNRGRTQPVSTMTDARLYRIIKPAVDAMRESAHEQS